MNALATLKRLLHAPNAPNRQNETVVLDTYTLYGGFSLVDSDGSNLEKRHDGKANKGLPRTPYQRTIWQERSPGEKYMASVLDTYPLYGGFSLVDSDGSNLEKRHDGKANKGLPRTPYHRTIWQERSPGEKYMASTTWEISFVEKHVNRKAERVKFGCEYKINDLDERQLFAEEAPSETIWSRFEEHMDVSQKVTLKRWRFTSRLVHGSASGDRMIGRRVRKGDENLSICETSAPTCCTHDLEQEMLTTTRNDVSNAIQDRIIVLKHIFDQNYHTFENENLSICETSAPTCCTHDLEQEMLTTTRNDVSNAIQDRIIVLKHIFDQNYHTFEKHNRGAISSSREQLHAMFTRTYGPFYQSHTQVFFLLVKPLTVKCNYRYMHTFTLICGRL
uniref:DUF569 domain-containing protein n=1 Tax=Ascaris lumbricoides TaxID=6252 RepID=A0A0M3ILV5_ASCLU